MQRLSGSMTGVLETPLIDSAIPISSAVCGSNHIYKEISPDCATRTFVTDNSTVSINTGWQNMNKKE
jgi:hypothetical protein